MDGIERIKECATYCCIPYLAVKMKKIKKFFHNKGKLSIISNRTQSDAVPEEQRNIPRYIAKRSDLYNKINADDYWEKKSNGSNITVEAVQPKVSSETLHVNGFGENQMQLERMERLESVEDIRNCTERDLVQESSALRSVKNRPVVCVTPEPVMGLNSSTLEAVGDICNNSADSINGVTNNLELKELNQIAHELSQDLAPKKLCDDKKSGGNTYVITISNSTHFHIGSSKTINYPDVEPNMNKKNENQLSEISYRKSLTLNASHLLDIEDKLSDDDLLQISLSVWDKWRDFVKRLGVDDAAIHDLENLYDKDYNLIIYDVLKQYLSRYPNTTVGYMISLLKKNNEIGAIEKLMDKR